MKALFLPLVVLTALPVFSQSIDSLRTDEQVVKFVRGLNQYYQNLSIVPSKHIYSALNHDSLTKCYPKIPYVKADFDGNGSTDLLFNGYDVNGADEVCSIISFIVLSFGRDSFAIKELTQGSFIDFFSAKKIVLDGKVYIETLKIQTQRNDSIEFRKDTLTYLCNEFVEKSLPNQDTIKRIEYCAWGGLIFGGLHLIITDSFTVLTNGRCIGRPKSTMDSGGYFQTNIDAHAYRNIVGLLRNMDFIHLKEEYEVRWTDDLWGILTITYNEGKIKKVRDYGLIGTYGLAALQRMLFDLRESQHWEKIKEFDEGLIICSD
jgi:hypothetical protein